MKKIKNILPLWQQTSEIIAFANGFYVISSDRVRCVYVFFQKRCRCDNAHHQKATTSYQNSIIKIMWKEADDKKTGIYLEKIIIYFLRLSYLAAWASSFAKASSRSCSFHPATIWWRVRLRAWNCPGPQLREVPKMKFSRFVVTSTMNYSGLVLLGGNCALLQTPLSGPSTDVSVFASADLYSCSKSSDLENMNEKKININVFWYIYLMVYLVRYFTKGLQKKICYL